MITWVTTAGLIQVGQGRKEAVRKDGEKENLATCLVSQGVQ